MTEQTEFTGNTSEKVIWQLISWSINDPFFEEYINKETGLLTQRGEEQLALGIKLLMLASWKMSDAHGFHDSGRPFSEAIALIHSEVSEALEAWRSNDAQLWYMDEQTFSPVPQNETRDGKPRKAEGMSAEFADILIRIGDVSEEEMFNLIWALITKMRYNNTRPHMHGKRA